MLERYPLAGDVLMSEDQEWSRRVLLDGLEIVYEPRAAVRHSHAYTVAARLPPLLRLGRLRRPCVRERGERVPGALRRSRRAVRARRDRWLWRTRQLRWLPYAALYESAKFVGLQLGLRHQRIPDPAEASDELAARAVARGAATCRTAPRERSGSRVCLVYDHLYPQTVGGAERWMRDLGLHLARTGNDVTHVTMRHWSSESPPTRRTSA